MLVLLVLVLPAGAAAMQVTAIDISPEKEPEAHKLGARR
jgi:D-arabinose 1-dehydrogenase-like Zn-dependent alcohol dehydrogenase